MAAAARDPLDLLAQVPNPIELLDVEEARRSLLAHTRMWWPVIEPESEWVDGWAVGCICEHLQAQATGELGNVIYNVPPGTSKSTLVNVMLSTWEWGPLRRPNLRYISWAYSDDLTVRDNIKARAIVEHPRFARLFPHLRLDRRGEKRFTTTARGFRHASGIKGGATGHRANRLIIDDPHNVLDSDSKAERNRAVRFVSNVVPTRLTKAGDDPPPFIAIIMQRVHERDVSGFLLAKELGYEWLCLPMEYDGRRSFSYVKREDVKPQRVALLKLEGVALPVWHVEGEPLPAGATVETQDPVYEERWDQERRTEEGELLFPELFDRATVEKLKRQLRADGGEYAVAGQMQQRPVPREGGMFHREDFTILDRMPTAGKRARWVRAYDLAATKRKNSPWTVGVRCALLEDGRFVVAHVDRLRGKPGEIDERLQANARLDGPSVHIDYPQDPGQAGVAQVAHFAKLLHGFKIHHSPESGPKEDRARGWAGQAEAGNVYLLRGEWNDTYINECTGFPGGEFSDQIDATSRGYTRALRLRPTAAPVAPIVSGED